LLEDALRSENTSDENVLYLAALVVESEHTLSAEMDDWEVSTIADGPSDCDPAFRVACARG
jgi:hypothetical protein